VRFARGAQSSPPCAENPTYLEEMYLWYCGSIVNPISSGIPGDENEQVESIEILRRMEEGIYDRE